MIHTLHMKCAIFFVILCSITFVCTWPDIKENDVSDDSDDEQKLKEALILVDLLKNEYMKALRENREMKQVEDKTTTTTSTTVQESTCASSDEPNVKLTPQINPRSMSTLPRRISTRATTARPNTKMSRTKKKPVKSRKLFKKKTTTKTNRRRLPGAVTHSFRKSIRRNRDFEFHKFRRQMYNAKPTTRKSDRIIQLDHTPEPQWMNDDDYTNSKRGRVVLDSTLGEMKKPTKSDATIGTEKYPSLPSLEFDIDSDEMDQVKPKYLTMVPTLRVHLGGSSRLPIPLPGNNAFCYTNPESPLCRASF